MFLTSSTGLSHTRTIFLLSGLRRPFNDTYFDFRSSLFSLSRHIVCVLRDERETT